jgi:spermidine dehydrogenase
MSDIDPKEARELGMDRRISRRDFLNGVAVGAATSLVVMENGEPAIAAEPTAQSAGAQSPAPDGYYPPTRTGLRGSHPGSFEVAHRVRDGAYRQFPPVDVDTREVYDLVVVGAGISGMAAAFFFQNALGQDRRVLLLDNHDDVGGHAKRNEFHYNGRLFIGVGGTLGIATNYPYSYQAKSLIREIGIQVERYNEYVDSKLFRSLGLSRGTFFDKEHFGEDRLVVGEGSIPWPEFFAKTPMSDQAKKDLTRLYTEKQDYFPGMAEGEKRARLAKMSYKDYLLTVAHVSPDALPYFNGRGYRNNMRVDTVPALVAAFRGAAGFDGLGLKLDRSFKESSYAFHFPDGGASVARLLCKRIVPRAFDGEQNQETIVTAKLHYDRLDEENASVRIRLNSTVVRVQHEGSPDILNFAEGGIHEPSNLVRVAYMKDGKVHGVRARNCVLACYNSIVRFLAPELPEPQKEALAYPAKVPLVYSSVFIRNWKAFHKLGVQNVSAPNMWHTAVGLDQPVSIGDYKFAKSPDEPTVLHLSTSPNKPGLPRKQQHKAGWHQLLETSWEHVELETRRELTRILGPGGFDPAADILGIAVNRWPHGYAYTYDSLSDPDVPDEERPHVLGRRPFGRIAIANSDAGAGAFMNEAIDQARRAVDELVRRSGLM